VLVMWKVKFEGLKKESYYIEDPLDEALLIEDFEMNVTYGCTEYEVTIAVMSLENFVSENTGNGYTHSADCTIITEDVPDENQLRECLLIKLDILNYKFSSMSVTRATEEEKRKILCGGLLL